MFTEVKCYTLNTDHIVYIDKDERAWTIHFSNGESLLIEDAWIADLKRLLQASPSPEKVAYSLIENDGGRQGKKVSNGSHSSN